MPELPEVQTIKSDLEKAVCGAKIIRVLINNPKVIRQPSPAVFKKSLEGLSIKRMLRRGKLLILELSNGKFLTVHFKMTGQLVLRTTAVKNKLSDITGSSVKTDSRVTFYLSGDRVLDFNDQRLFAELRLLDDWQEMGFIQRLGPEPFDLTYSAFKDMLLKRKTGIKPLLMDQSFIAGIGNIYAAEILFHARIDPRRPAQSLKEKEQALLYKHMQAVLKSAIKHGGSSVDDYVRVSGKNGDYGRFHQVYGREGKPCFVCSRPVERIVQGGRGTYFCPKCQV
ncbi:MAG: bifunctional DNA-formamidopyrimidine glycosylase/DNA-(apurinic or apyrimidinic site) lyase [Candidatus Omnitrophica bacterium]|nr:bifunctional DNA-formamidopyrimidine glycosylase/DNA-(apurinic or apyrimidinic site) lyase [Candidatus Omnitrophota bacterium]